MEIKLTKTFRTLADCWSSAEAQLIEKIGDRYPDADEEFITRLFHGELKATLDQANAAKRFAHAFLHDLTANFNGFRVEEGVLDNTARGFTADVRLHLADATLHHKGTEKRSGGDLGLVIARPLLTQSYGEVESFDIERSLSGLLVQAKLRSRGGSWGKLTGNQKKVLPN